MKNDFENMVTNDLLSNWLPIENARQPKTTIAKVVIKEEILNNGKKQSIWKNVVLEDKNRTLDKDLPMVVENSEKKIETVKEENYHYLNSHKSAYTKSYFMQIILSIDSLLTIFINRCNKNVFSSYTRNMTDRNIFEYGDQDLKNVAEGLKHGFGNGTIQWLRQFLALEPLQVEDTLDKRGLKK